MATFERDGSIDFLLLFGCTGSLLGKPRDRIEKDSQIAALFLRYYLSRQCLSIPPGRWDSEEEEICDLGARVRVAFTAVNFLCH